MENDLKLANEAFTRAQSNDPDYAHAWLGQGFVALLYGDAREARGFFTHAMDISESSSLMSRQLYSVSMFDHILTAPTNLPVTSLIQPLFALGQLRGLKPQDLAYGHLSTLFQERTHDSTPAVSTLESICATAESEYQETELPQALKRFALAKTDLARSYLSTGEFQKAIDAGALGLELSSDESDNELTPEERRKARLSAHLTVGLAHHYNGDFAEATACFEAALEESDDNPDAVCILAQVLWATGTEESKERARDVLFEVIEKTPNHVQSVLLLGAIALLDKDDESLEAVVAELQGLRVSDQGVTATERSHVGEVLRAIVAGAENSKEEDVLGQAQTDVMLHPYLPHGWSGLAGAAGEEVEEEAQAAAEMALMVARKGVPPRGDLTAEELARAYAGTGRAADAQTAIVVAPWAVEGWITLGDAVRC